MSDRKHTREDDLDPTEKENIPSIVPPGFRTTHMFRYKTSFSSARHVLYVVVEFVTCFVFFIYSDTLKV